MASMQHFEGMQFVSVEVKDAFYQNVSTGSEKVEKSNHQIFTVGNFEIIDKLGSLVKFKSFVKRKEALPT